MHIICLGSATSSSTIGSATSSSPRSRGSLKATHSCQGSSEACYSPSSSSQHPNTGIGCSQHHLICQGQSRTIGFHQHINNNSPYGDGWTHPVVSGRCYKGGERALTPVAPQKVGAKVVFSPPQSPLTGINPRERRWTSTTPCHLPRILWVGPEEYCIWCYQKPLRG